MPKLIPVQMAVHEGVGELPMLCGLATIPGIPIIFLFLVRSIVIGLDSGVNSWIIF